MADCATCQGAKIAGFCKNCSCSVCGAQPPPLTIYMWKNGGAIRLCDKHIKIVDMTRINKREFDVVVFITS